MHCLAGSAPPPAAGWPWAQPCPEFVCYGGLQSMRRQVKAKKGPAATKTYMRGVTIVKKQWLWEMGVQDTMGPEVR